jgi:hypothetical protein
LYQSMMASLLLSMFLVAGCSGPVSERLNCRRVCNAYEDCVDSSYDTRDCISRCSSDSADDDEYARQVDQCETCIDNRSCAEIGVACASDCAGIVP